DLAVQAEASATLPVALACLLDLSRSSHRRRLSRNLRQQLPHTPHHDGFLAYRPSSLCSAQRFQQYRHKKLPVLRLAFRSAAQVGRELLHLRRLHQRRKLPNSEPRYRLPSTRVVFPPHLKGFHKPTSPPSATAQNVVCLASAH